MMTFMMMKMQKRKKVFFNPIKIQLAVILRFYANKKKIMKNYIRLDIPPPNNNTLYKSFFFYAIDAFPLH